MKRRAFITLLGGAAAASGGLGANADGDVRGHCRLYRIVRTAWRSDHSAWPWASPGIILAVCRASHPVLLRRAANGHAAAPPSNGGGEDPS
jgi:hypothetical protein